jgi:hypothetical protein
MRRIALAVAVLTGLIAPAFAQRAEIEAVNAKWVDFFNKGDFAGVASLYTDDATAFPPGAGMMKGRAAIEAMWKGAAEQVGDPKFITLEVKPLGPSGVGNGTANRKWINHEIVKAWDDGLGVVGVYIHGLKNLAGQISTKGSNPFDCINYGNTGRKLSSVVKCYDPAGATSKDRYDWISTHLANAVEEAIKIRNNI